MPEAHDSCGEPCQGLGPNTQSRLLLEEDKRDLNILPQKGRNGARGPNSIVQERWDHSLRKVRPGVRNISQEGQQPEEHSPKG